ncbi:hypothetical protein SY83_21925 [Paenibacillus swuensis]|uniref:AraC family transcriptional regulator n=1 Tax=Paenibacillus swuensis TaxID=1178515 RepID=A0A172TN71_9BACL|nr:response regulator [Paenibacillus swuensis]ANE48501.1 hypothetical protein SY83_21925 [Paenibacillus swuensis]
MYKIMIVDDEPSVLDAITSQIPWESLQITSVMTASSGKEALELFQEENIDIVISDIQMPVMDGLALVEQIKEKKPHTRCILLTGYADFHYAQTALKHQVSDYLLKPIAVETIIEAVQKITDELASEWSHVSSYQHALYTLKENLPFLRSRLLADLLSGRRMEHSVLEEKLTMLEISIHCKDVFWMLLIRLEEDFLHYDRNSRELLEYAILNIAGEVLGHEVHLWYGKDDHDYLVLLIGDAQASERSSFRKELERKAEELLHQVQLYLKGALTMIISEAGEFPNQVSQFYDSLLYEMRRTLPHQQGWLKTVNSLDVSQSARSLKRLYEPPVLMHLLEAGRWEEAEKTILRIMEELTTVSEHSAETVNEVYHAFLAAFHYNAHKSGVSLVEIVGIEPLELRHGDRRSIPIMTQWAIGIVDKLRKNVDQDHRESTTALIGQIREFLEQRLSDDVSLQAIAEHLYMNPKYISRLYKLETGENISDYLFRLRMERSAYYLKNTNMKIQQICEKLGYQSTSYYIRLFKKHYSVTPQEFRNS